MLIDIHVHAHRKRHPGVARPTGFQMPTPEELIRIMDDIGVDKAVIMSSVSPECHYTQIIPEEIIDICAEYSGRLIPFCNVDPRYMANDSTSNFINILNAYKEMGCKGVGEYTPNLPFDDPLNINVFKQVEEVGLPLTFHVSHKVGGMYGCYDDPGLPRLEKVLKACPRLIFLAHSQVFWAEIGPVDPQERHKAHKSVAYDPIEREGRVVELMRKYPNLHGDISAYSGCYAISRDLEFGYKFMEEFQDRLYWGTDVVKGLPMVPYFRKLKEECLIPSEIYEKITWKNANRLLGLNILE